MQAQAQYTIHSLNDVVASNTAPSSPYKGQLWVNTSYSPPRTFVYNGSAWKEQNGTDTLRTNISTLTTKSNTMRSDLDGLTSTVSSVTTRVETLEDDLGVIEETVLDVQSSVTELEQTATSIALRVTTNETNITSLTADVNGLKTRVSNAEGDISTLEQTTDSLTATIATKADSSGGSSSSFGWSLTSSGFYLYSNSSTVMSVTSSGLSVDGEINAKSGTISELTVTGRLYFGGNDEYYIDPNYDDGSYYIYLPGFRVDDASGAVFSGKLSAPSGTIGGFTIGTSSIYKSKTAYSNTTAGVYVGTDGIGLGAGTFYVTSAGALTATSGAIGAWSITSSYLGSSQSGGSFYITSASDSSAYWIRAHNAASGGGTRTFSVSKTGELYATSADITGKITATSGKISNLTIEGKLTFGGNSSYYINANYNDSSWYLRLPGMTSDEASGTVFSGKLSAPTGKIGGWTIGTTSLYCTITNSDGTKKGTGFQAPSTGIWAIAVGYDSEDSWANAPFRVNHSGALYATSATITGTFSNKKTSGLGLEISGSTLSFYNGSTKIGHLTGGTGYIPWNNSSSTVSGVACSALFCADGGVRVGKSLQLSTGNGIYVSNKLALTMGQVKVQTNTGVQRYLLFYCGILVGIGSSKYSGISDYSASTYTG